REAVKERHPTCSHDAFDDRDAGEPTLQCRFLADAPGVAAGYELEAAVRLGGIVEVELSRDQRGVGGAERRAQSHDHASSLRLEESAFEILVPLLGRTFEGRLHEDRCLV